MLEAPKAFWVLVGIAVLIVAGAIAFMIVQGSSASVDVEGIKLEVGSAQQGITEAQASFTQLQHQAQAQAQEIAMLEQRLAQAQDHIRELVATIQGLPQAPAAAKGAAKTFLSEASHPVPQVPRFDPALLSKTRAQLQQAQTSVVLANAKLNAQKK
jgi:hypothetical protein